VESRVIVKLIAFVCRGLSVTHRPLYYAEVSAVSALPHLTHTPTDPTSCPSPIAESRKFRTDALGDSRREKIYVSIYAKCLFKNNGKKFFYFSDIFIQANQNI